MFTDFLECLIGTITYNSLKYMSFNKEWETPISPYLHVFHSFSIALLWIFKGQELLIFPF